jgi:CheY-like chemotaxis protein
VFRDVSERERMAGQIAFLDRLVSLGTLSAGVAHEINNPLTFIVGNVEVLRDALAHGDMEYVGEAIEDIAQGAQRIAAIVRDLRTFARGGATGEPAPVELRSAVELALKLTGVTVRERARVVTVFEATRPALAVESRLVQVLVNLLINAAQAIPDGQPDPTVTIATRDEQGGVSIEVRDTGVGMAPGVIARAFEPFFTTKAMAGTGLGLSVCHGLVTAMGGTIALSSDGTSGTAARIWLPAARPVASPPRARTSTTLPPPMRVLVIDDEPQLLSCVARLLRTHKVVTADSWRAAVERLFVRRETYDVVLCDLQMPDGTGMDLYERVAAERPELAAAMVFVTGGALSERSEAFLQQPGRRWVAKPVTRDVLQQLIASAHPAALPT